MKMILAVMVLGLAACGGTQELFKGDQVVAELRDNVRSLRCHMCRLSLAAAFLLSFLISAPAHAARPTRMETVGLVAAETSLVMDAVQTLDIKNHAAFVEQNPILGPAPSDAAVVAYFAGTMLASAALWYVLPAKVRYLVPIVVLALEVPQVARNASRVDFDARYCARCDPRTAQRTTRGMSIKVRF